MLNRKDVRLNLAFVIAMLIVAAPTALAQRGAGAFYSVFSERATDYDRENAYLLTYLATAVYPERLIEIETGRLARAEKGQPDFEDYLKLNDNSNGEFEARFIKAVKPLFVKPDSVTIRPVALIQKGPAGAAPVAVTFARPTASTGPDFKWFHEGNETGYDPEAMAISTDDALFVVFRGTDRVAQNDPKSKNGIERLNYDLAEWLASDFDLIGISPGMGIPGKVHRGFWQSMTYDPHGRRGGGPKAFHLQVKDWLDDHDPDKKKPLWITGHSLGAAHSQTFAAFMTASGRRPQGVYAIAAPHVADDQMSDWMNAHIGKKRLQRFDFVDDPVTMLPPYVSGYRRSGTRNYFDDLVTEDQDAPERSILSFSAVLDAIHGAVVNGVAGAIQDAVNSTSPVKIRIDPRATNELGYHYPNWYLRAAYNKLPAHRKLDVPAPLPIPTAQSEGCNTGLVARAARNPVGRVADAVEETVDAIAYNIDQILKNTTGEAIEEGQYRIKCYSGGRYLDLSTDGVDKVCPSLWKGSGSPGNNVFKVSKCFGVGYKISRANKNIEVNLGEILDDGGRVQMWGDSITPNQVWLFYKTNKPDVYVLLNLNSFKALNAKDSGTTHNGGAVNQYKAKSNDTTMSWVFERVRS